MNTICSDASTKLQPVFSKNLIKNLEDNNSCTEQTGPRDTSQNPLRRRAPLTHVRSMRMHRVVLLDLFTDEIKRERQCFREIVI